MNQPTLNQLEFPTACTRCFTPILFRLQLQEGKGLINRTEVRCPKCNLLHAGVLVLQIRPLEGM